MHIKVCRSGRERTSVSVPDNATVSALKRVIEAQDKIPFEEQTLTFNGLILEDGNLISEYGLFDQCTILLYLRLGYQPDFDINIVLPSGGKLIVNVSGENTVEELKMLVEEKIGLSLSAAELIYDHWMLDNNRKLMEYDISAGATLLVVHELKDGPGLELRDSTKVKRVQLVPPGSHHRHQRQHRKPPRSSSYEDSDGMSESDDELITVIFLAKSGTPIALRVHPNTPVGKVRGKLAQILHVPSNEMGFVRDGKALNPSRTFAQYGISHGESVCLLSDDHVVENPRTWLSSEDESHEPKIRIIVQSKNGHTLACHVRQTTTVGALKRRLEKEVGVSKSKMGLFYQQTLLTDESRMRDYDLTDGSVVYLRY